MFTFLVAIVFKGVVLETVLGKEQSGTGSGTQKPPLEEWNSETFLGHLVESSWRNGRPIAARGLCCPNLSPRTRLGSQACCLVENRFGHLYFEI